MVTYNRAGMSIFTGYFGVQSSPFADKMNLVYGTDGKVYIQNPLWWNKSYNTWVWGDYDPETDTITAEGFFDPDQPFTVTFSYDDNYNVVWTEDGESTVMDYSYRTDNG